MHLGYGDGGQEGRHLAKKKKKRVRGKKSVNLARAVRVSGDSGQEGRHVAKEKRVTGLGRGARGALADAYLRLRALHWGARCCALADARLAPVSSAGARGCSPLPGTVPYSSLHTQENIYTSRKTLPLHT